MIRSIVVFPQPEAPRIAMISPSAISRSTPSSTRRLPKLRLSPAIVTALTACDLAGGSHESPGG